MEMYVLLLSLLVADGKEEHSVIRVFKTAEACAVFLPEYKTLIGEFNKPEGVLASDMNCMPHTYGGES